MRFISVVSLVTAVCVITCNGQDEDALNLISNKVQECLKKCMKLPRCSNRVFESGFADMTGFDPKCRLCLSSKTYDPDMFPRDLANVRYNDMGACVKAKKCPRKYYLPLEACVDCRKNCLPDENFAQIQRQGYNLYTSCRKGCLKRGKCTSPSSGQNMWSEFSCNKCIERCQVKMNSATLPALSSGEDEDHITFVFQNENDDPSQLYSTSTRSCLGKCKSLPKCDGQMTNIHEMIEDNSNTCKDCLERNKCEDDNLPLHDKTHCLHHALIRCVENNNCSSSALEPAKKCKECRDKCLQNGENSVLRHEHNYYMRCKTACHKAFECVSASSEKSYWSEYRCQQCIKKCRPVNLPTFKVVANNFMSQQKETCKRNCHKLPLCKNTKVTFYDNEDITAVCKSCLDDHNCDSTLFIREFIACRYKKLLQCVRRNSCTESFMAPRKKCTQCRSTCTVSPEQDQITRMQFQIHVGCKKSCIEVGECTKSRLPGLGVWNSFRCQTCMEKCSFNMRPKQPGDTAPDLPLQTLPADVSECLGICDLPDICANPVNPKAFYVEGDDVTELCRDCLNSHYCDPNQILVDFVDCRYNTVLTCVKSGSCLEKTLEPTKMCVDCRNNCSDKINASYSILNKRFMNYKACRKECTGCNTQSAWNKNWKEFECGMCIANCQQNAQ